MTTKESSIEDHRLYGSVGDYVSELLNRLGGRYIEFHSMSGCLTESMEKSNERDQALTGGNLHELLRSYPTRFHVGRIGKIMSWRDCP